MVTQASVNAMWLVPGEVGGTETYIRRVLASLALVDQDFSIRLFGSAEAAASVAPAGADVITAPIANRSRSARIAMERLWLARVMDTGVGVLHHPGGTVPFDSTTPTVVTIHDLQPLTNPEHFTRAKREFLSRALPEAAKRADVIATPSEWVRVDVIDRLGVDPDRVVSVSAYADVVDLSAPSTVSPQIDRILERGPTIMFPAMTLGHKNHRFLFDAFDLARETDPDLQLVCTGVDGKDHAEIVAYANSVSPSIHMLGHVTRDDLNGLFARAEMLVFPSQYEGFGLPVLEAQQSELPVIASTSTAIPEVAGDGAVLLDPNDLAGWADAMANRSGTIERAELVARGLSNARRYNAVATAKQQLGAYELAAS